jgi:hypothetical protein
LGWFAHKRAGAACAIPTSGADAGIPHGSGRRQEHGVAQAVEGERRGRHSGGVSHVDCRVCGAPVLLDPRRIRRRSDRSELTCTGCRAVLAIRRTDADRVLSSRDERPVPDALYGRVWRRR